MVHVVGDWEGDSNQMYSVWGRRFSSPALAYLHSRHRGSISVETVAYDEGQKLPSTGSKMYYY